mgnify:FL=1
MIKSLKIFLMGVGTLLWMTACQDTLTEHPDSYYEKEDFFTSEAKAEMGVIGIYNVLPTLYGDSEMAFGASDDTYYASGTNTDNARRDIAHYMLSTTNKYVEAVWQATYQGIERANYMIEGIQKMQGFAENEKLQSLVAEAKFLRAFLSFNLVKYWGDVPYKTTSTGSYEEAYQPRTSREVIYDQIVDDLDDAKENMSWANETSSPERATQGAARALLMRVLLQRAGYSLQMDGTMTRPEEELRQTYFAKVIDEWEAFQENGYHDFYEGGYEALFKSFSAGELHSKESIFEVAFYTVDGRTGARGYWGTYNGPLVPAPGIEATETDKFMGRANALFRVIPEWRDFFEESDVRRDVMICTYQYDWDKTLYNHVKKDNIRNKKNWYPGKWRREWMPLGYKDPNITDVNYCSLRYADVVLMAAEAYNETGETAQAWKLLNRVRQRAGATEITSANYASLMKSPKVYDLPFIEDGDEAGRFRTALYWERGFELAFELQRRFDLLRWGVLGDALQLMASKTVVNQSAEKSFLAGYNFVSGKHELFPIPLDEIQVNYCLENKNNPNY